MLHQGTIMRIDFNARNNMVGMPAKHEESTRSYVRSVASRSKDQRPSSDIDDYSTRIGLGMS